MSKTTSRKSGIQRIIILLSGMSFLFSSLFLLVKLIKTPPSVPETTTETNSVTEQLKAEEQGYLLVLEREPDNVTALQGLIDIRIKLNDLQGTIAPLEKLITIYPEDENLKMLLDTIKTQLAVQEQNK